MLNPAVCLSHNFVKVTNRCYQSILRGFVIVVKQTQHGDLSPKRLRGNCRPSTNHFPNTNSKYKVLPAIVKDMTTICTVSFCHGKGCFGVQEDQSRQECISVGCVSFTAVAICGGDVCLGGLSAWGVSAQEGVCLPGGVCLGGVSALSVLEVVSARHPHGQNT